MARASEWRQGDIVLADHAFDCRLPAFRRGARPGNALQVSLLVGGVARSTFGQHQGVGDGDAGVGLALREHGGASNGTAEISRIPAVCTRRDGLMDRQLRCMHASVHPSLDVIQPVAKKLSSQRDHRAAAR